MTTDQIEAAVATRSNQVYRCMTHTPELRHLTLESVELAARCTVAAGY